MFHVHPIFEVLLAAREPPEPKRPLRAAIALDMIQYIYSGGSVEVIPQGCTRYALGPHEPQPALVRDVAIRSLLPRLRCASISAHPAITAKLRKRILSLPASRTMEDLRRFLFWGKPDSLLTHAIRKRHLPAATTAFVSLVDSIASSHAHRNIAKADTPWIVPNEHLRAVVAGRLDDLPLAARQALSANFGLGSNDSDPAWRNWLPSLTLGATSTLRNAPLTTLRALNQALVALVSYMSIEVASTHPWNAKFPDDLRSVPTYAMFPFRPEPSVRKAIADLASQEVRTVGDLRCLHPQAIGLAKATNNPLVRLYASFREPPKSASDIGVF